MYVHTMEMSPFPERALRAADQLRDLVPDAGHLVHMPTHIDVLCGNYRDVVTGNRRAIVADRKFLEREGALNFYTLYRCHDYHFTIYGAMFLGQPEPALEAAAELRATLTEELLRIEVPVMADWLEGFVPMRLHVLVRFGMWDEILAEPFPDDAQLYCVTTAMLHYAKGVAHAATGDLAAADEQRRLFREAHARVPDTRYLFNNTCLDALAVAGAMLDGEIEYRRGALRRRLRAPAPLGRARRQPALRRALGLDAADPPRAGRAAARTGPRRAGGGRLPGRPGPRLDAQSALPAPRQRLEPARVPRVPDATRQARRGRHRAAAPAAGACRYRYPEGTRWP